MKFFDSVNDVWKKEREKRYFFSFGTIIVMKINSCKNVYDNKEETSVQKNNNLKIDVTWNVEKENFPHTFIESNPWSTWEHFFGPGLKVCYSVSKKGSMEHEKWEI